MRIDNARPYVFEVTALRRAVARLEALASPPRPEDDRTDGTGMARIQPAGGAALLWTIGPEAMERATRLGYRDLVAA